MKKSTQQKARLPSIGFTCIFLVLLTAAWVLGQIDDKSAIPALVEALKSDDHNVRRKEDSTLCENIDIDNPEIKTIIPHIVSTCTISKKGSSIKQVLKELGYII